MVVNISSTPSPVLAETKKKLRPALRQKFSTCYLLTFHSISDLLPTMQMISSGSELFLASCSQQFQMSENDWGSARLNTIKTAWEPALISIVCTSIVGTCNGPKSLLTGRIPDLKLTRKPIHFMSLESKVHADRRQIIIEEVPVTKTQKQAGLSHPLVAYNHHFKGIIVFLYHQQAQRFIIKKPKISRGSNRSEDPGGLLKSGNTSAEASTY